MTRIPDMKLSGVDWMDRALLRVRYELLFHTHACIDHRRRLIFIHVPKCAGTALGQLLGLTETNHDTAAYYPNLA